MYCTSKSNSDLKHHDKALNYLKEELKFLPFDFIKEDCIISGSLIIKALFRPQAIYKDIDFYFQSEKQKKKIENILKQNGYNVVADTPNATTLDNNINKQVQLIKLYMTPQEITKVHDFTNAAISFHKGIFYINVNAFKAWRKNELSINSFPWQLLRTPEAFKAQFTILLQRIEKYCKRYNLSLDETFLKNILKMDKTSLSLVKVTELEFHTLYQDYNGTIVAPFPGGELNKVVLLLKTYYPSYQDSMLYGLLK